MRSRASNARPKAQAHTFTTLRPLSAQIDACPNAHVRQQTSAAQLLDCRAYELVSAANTGGYDVESDLVAGQTPFAGYPEAENLRPRPLRRPRRRHPRHRRPDQPRRRSLRRHPHRSGWSPNTSASPPPAPLLGPLLLCPPRSRRRPRNLRLRRPRSLLALLLLPASKPASPSASQAANSSRAWSGPGL